MTTSQRTILQTLKQFTNPTTATGLQAYELAAKVGQPEPSMRRNVQALRKYGYDITVSPWRGYILRNPGAVSGAVSGSRF